MKKNELMKSVNLTFNKIGFQIKKKSPEILIVAGVAGVVVSAVMACQATIKAQEVAEETKNTLDDIHEAEAAGVTKAGKTYTQDDTRRDLVGVYVNSGKAYARIYAPSVLVGLASITAIVTSHNIMRKRNIAITAAYTTLDKSYKEYRNRVMERFGEQIEKEIRYNIKAGEVEKTVTDEKGKTKKVKEVVNMPASANWDPSKYSPYARCFDETHKQWSRDIEMGRYYLKARQSQATDMLRSRGHLFLNEVYDMLDFPRTKAGAAVGWLYDPKRPELGDTYVDFGMFEVHTPREEDGGYDVSFVLDFNVVGDITDEIADHQFI